MSIASSWLDVVVGIDFHIEIVPTPAPTPTPFPHPHCSVIWDPVGYVMGEITGMAFAAIVGAPIQPAGPVLVGGSMGTVARCGVDADQAHPHPAGHDLCRRSPAERCGSCRRFPDGHLPRKQCRPGRRGRASVQ